MNTINIDKQEYNIKAISNSGNYVDVEDLKGKWAYLFRHPVTQNFVLSNLKELNIDTGIKEIRNFERQFLTI